MCCGSGFIGLVEVIPQVTVSLFAGHFSDIWNRHKIIKYSSLLLISGAVILLIYSIDADYFSAKYRNISVIYINLSYRAVKGYFKSCTDRTGRAAGPTESLCQCCYLEQCKLAAGGCYRTCNRRNGLRFSWHCTGIFTGTDFIFNIFLPDAADKDRTSMK